MKSISWNDYDENVVITDGWAEERHECQCGRIVDGFEWRTWGSCYDCYDRATNPARWYE